MGQHFVTAALTLCSMTLTVLANLSLKVGVQRQGDLVSRPFTLINTHVALGAASFALAFLFYALVLRRLPLSLAQAIFSVQFVFGVLAANLVLHESIGTARWMGIALVAAGLLVVTLSPESKPVGAIAEQVAD